MQRRSPAALGAFTFCRSRLSSGDVIASHSHNNHNSLYRAGQSTASSSYRLRIQSFSHHRQIHTCLPRNSSCEMADTTSSSAERKPKLEPTSDNAGTSAVKREAESGEADGHNSNKRGRWNDGVSLTNRIQRCCITNIPPMALSSLLKLTNLLHVTMNCTAARKW